MALFNSDDYKVDYSADGSDVDELTRKYIALVDKMSAVIAVIRTLFASGTEPTGTDRGAWSFWLDTHDPENIVLRVRNKADAEWIPFLRLAPDAGITAVLLKAVQDQGISILAAGNDIDLPTVGTAKRMYVAVDAGKLYYDNGTTWDLFFDRSHTHNTMGSKPIDLTGLADQQVLVWYESLGKFKPRDIGGEQAVTQAQLQQILAQLATLDVTRIGARLDTVESTSAELALIMEAEGWLPEFSAMLLETFTTANYIDTFSCSVTSVVAGDNSIDVDNVIGLLPGAYYALTDGIKSETVQIKSVNVSGTTKRVILNTDIVNMYQQGNVTLYRSTAYIANGKAYGPAESSIKSWTVDDEWKGVHASVPATVTLNTTLSNASAFNITSSIEFSTDGAITLKPSVITGIALIATGGGAGTWTSYEGSVD